MFSGESDGRERGEGRGREREGEGEGEGAVLFCANYSLNRSLCSVSV